MHRAIMWVLLIAFAWPLTQILIYLVRFGEISGSVVGSSLAFLPMGLASAAILVLLFERSTNIYQKACTVFGYVLASPFALMGSLLGGLVAAQVLGTLIYGTVPLMIGTVIGYVVGGVLNRQEAV